MEVEALNKARVCFICFVFFTLVGIIAYKSTNHTMADNTGIVTVPSGGGLNVRAGAGSDMEVIGSVSNGTTITILEDCGNGWLKIKYDSKEGYISSDYVVRESFDAVFIEEMVQSGFPESYAIPLAKLHEKYPDWQFVPQVTGLEWSTVIANESKLGKNNVASTSLSSWKSIEKGAYNLNKGTWVAMDGASWIAASENIIEYYMDPRNFLDEDSVFMYLSHAYDESRQNEESLKEMLKGTYLEGTYKAEGDSYKYSETIMKAAADYSVNPYVLAAMMLVEQGSDGRGQSISGKVSGYEGYYNFFNIGAYASGGMSAIQRGLWFARGDGASTYNRPWNNIYKAILGGSEYYSSNYVKKGQDTVYLKKFNVQGSNLYNHQYMTNIQGAELEGKKIYSAYSNIKSTKLVFKIPVYTNMPATKAEAPSGNGDPVNYLKGITVDKYSLNPAFDPYKSEYSLIVDNSVTKVNISAETYSAKASIISGAGDTSLKVGMNTVEIAVQAENGVKRTYKLNISREDGPLGNEEDGASEGNDNKEPETGTKEPEGNKTVKMGDVNKDDKINISDLLMIQKSILGLESLEGDAAAAADLNNNGKIDIADLLKLQKHILGIETIE